MNSKFLDRFFKPVDGMVWDIMSGRVGVKSKDGITTLELGELSDDKTEAPDAQVTINLFDDFGMEVPAFSQSTPIESLNLGDMIYSSSANKILGWIVKKGDKSFKILKPDGTRSDWTPPKVQMLGFDSGVMVIRSLMNMLPGGESGLGQMQSSLLPLMMMGGGDSDELKSMMPLLLMSQVGTLGNNGSPSMMNNMVQMMMMQKMMGSNFNMFGGKSSNTSGKNFFDRS
jgi:hypothetical protein